MNRAQEENPYFSELIFISSSRWTEKVVTQLVLLIVSTFSFPHKGCSSHTGISIKTHTLTHNLHSLQLQITK